MPILSTSRGGCAGRRSQCTNALAAFKRPTIPITLIQLLALLCLAGCQALAGADSLATIGADMTLYAAERDGIRAAATSEQNMSIETLVAASTQIAEYSAVNAALGATLRANQTATPAVQPVVVSADDMGASLVDDMRDESEELPGVAYSNEISDIAPALAVDRNGCAVSPVAHFSPTAERIYVTARVTGLRAGTGFSIEWTLAERPLSEYTWTAEASHAILCIWFYATPADFLFLPGDYSATLYVDAAAAGSAEFTIGES